MRTSIYLGALSLAVGASAVVALTSACSDDKDGNVAPTPVADSGERDTGPASDAAPVCVDEPNCVTCASIFGAPPACLIRPVCCANHAPGAGAGKSSTQIGNEAVACACTKCQGDCAVTCGQLKPPIGACLECVIQQCPNEVQACRDDVGADPMCNGPADAGTDDAGDGG